MSDVLPEATRRVVRTVGPEPSTVQRDMADYARDQRFPIIGPEAGGVLRLLVRLVGARTVFEFGSGFGYSATWFAAGLPADGRVVLTEDDADELSLARDYLDAAGVADRAVFEHGDALEIVGRYDGPFDVVLIDLPKARYVEALDAASPRLAAGGVVIADNVLSGPHDPEDIARALDGSREPDPSVRGIIDYLDRVRADPSLETTIVPVGNGLAVSAQH